MTFGPAVLADQLAKLEGISARPARYVIAFSGGLDSTVLAHALAQISDVPLLAVHIDHGMQSDSADWSEQCAQTAAALEIEFRSLRVDVQVESGKGPEASAREARYSALQAELVRGDWLLSAHHREDQAETALLNLIRGSGPAGVAGIGSMQRFGPGWLARPMLNVARSDVLKYATDLSLKWVEDASNSDRRFDRNFLRHEVVPLLKSRWPEIAVRLHRSAGHAGEASQLLVELAAIDLEGLGSGIARLPIEGLKELSAARQRNVLRYALHDLGLSTPTALQLERVLTEVIPAREDGQPLVSWPGASVRRYRNNLYLLPEHIADFMESTPVLADELELGDGLGTLRFEPGAEIGISAALFGDGLTVKRRVGGEKFRPVGQSHTRKLKKLLQENGIVPWMRERLPLVCSGERLIAVGDLWLAEDAVSRPGIKVRWIDRPALH